MKNISKIASSLSILALLAGCGENRSSQPAAETPPDYSAEARETITEENMDAHLEALEAEITADESSLEP